MSQVVARERLIWQIGVGIFLRQSTVDPERRAAILIDNGRSAAAEEKQPTDRRRSPRDLGDGALGKIGHFNFDGYMGYWR